MCMTQDHLEIDIFDSHPPLLLLLLPSQLFTSHPELVFLVLLRTTWSLLGNLKLQDKIEVTFLDFSFFDFFVSYNPFFKPEVFCF